MNKLLTKDASSSPVAHIPTMSSLELVDYINADRKAKAEAAGLTFPCKKYCILKHNDFLKKVPKVLGEEHSGKFFAQYKDSTGRELPCYRFPKRKACLMANRQRKSREEVRLPTSSDFAIAIPVLKPICPGKISWRNIAEIYRWLQVVSGND